MLKIFNIQRIILVFFAETLHLPKYVFFNTNCPTKIISFVNHECHLHNKVEWNQH
jgi:hypothetical protein